MTAGLRLRLASTSPRRVELLRGAGFDVEVRPSGAVEWPYPGGDPAGYAESLARAKVAGAPSDPPVVGADTVVVLDGQVLGKPRDPDDAADMLGRLSGRTHHVVTAVAVAHLGIVRCAHAGALVTFRALTPAEIAGYVASGEPVDKAGAYAIQGGGLRFVERLDGDRETVIGLPTALLRRLLAEVLAEGQG